MSKTIRFSDLRQGAAPSDRAARSILRTVRRAAAEGNRAFAASMVRRGVPAGHGVRVDV